MFHRGNDLIRFVACSLVFFLSACASSGPELPEQKPIDKHKLSQIYTQMGAAYLSEGQPLIAVKELKKAIKLDPDNAEAHGSIAVLYEQLEMFDKAQKHYLKALDLSPDDPRIVNNYGRFLCERGEKEEGLELLTRAANDRLYANRWIPMANAGECALAAGELEEAEKWLRQALELNPDSPNALAAMARVKAQQGQFLSARAFLQRYESKVKEPDQEMLRLGYQIETALGDSQAAESYRKRLNED